MRKVRLGKGGPRPAGSCGAMIVSSARAPVMAQSVQSVCTLWAIFAFGSRGAAVRSSPVVES
jgi:hypothetical protein